MVSEPFVDDLRRPSWTADGRSSTFGDQDRESALDREAGGITPITLWESEEAMKAIERATAMRSSVTAAIDGSVVSVDRYEVGYLIQP